MNDAPITIRRAVVADVPGIATLINAFAERGKMLFRSHAELYETVRDFVVAENGAQVVGVCALEVIWSDLAEVRSLAVDPAWQGKRIGGRLVEAVIGEAQALGVQRVFALTYEQRFFERLGFAVVDKAALPLKVWSECIKCPKRDGCDEIAVVKTVLDRPTVVDDNPDTHPDLRYDVPTPFVQLQVRDKPQGSA